MATKQQDYWSQVASVMVDRVIGDSEYQILEELGRGSYGCLFLGQSLHNNNYVAIKVLSKLGLDHQQLQIQQMEADIQSQLKDHPHILKLHRVIQDQDFIFMVMELCDQGDLFDFVTRGEMDEQLVKTLYLQILDAVEYMHAQNVYHRDIKLENILLKSDNDDDLICKVADFGLATRDRLSMEFGCGSTTYLAPEHFDDDDNNQNNEDLPYDSAMSDVWSLGILLIAMLFGQNPWQEATSHDPAFAEFKRQPATLKRQLFPKMSVACYQFLKSVLALNPSDRPSVAEMKQRFLALDRLVDDTTTTWVDEQEIPTATKPSGRASFDSAFFSGATSWSDMVQEEEEMLLQKQQEISSMQDDEEEEQDEDDDTDMFIHSHEKQSWWL